MATSRTEAIKLFLNNNTHLDLAKMYTPDMECQVNVAQDGGERTENTFKGKHWHGYTDGITTWKSFRIPRNADTNPEFEDIPMSFSLAEHAEGIGMTGWDFQNKLSRWVAFDFDAVTNHAKGLTNEELEKIRTEVSIVPWVSIRKSTSGKGLHLYVFFKYPPQTANHNEHSALARAVLSTLCGLVGYDFSTKVDICGGNMWVWHRKMAGTDGLKVIKEGIQLDEVPANWREHIDIIKNRKRKIISTNLPDNIEDLVSKNPKVPLDEEHKKLISYLQNQRTYSYWWDSDKYMLVTHTKILEQAHKELNMRGKFSTKSEGKDPATPNCFLFPLRKGAWTVRRYSLGTAEVDSWEQDLAGWTRTYLNKDIDFKTACRMCNGIEDSDGSYQFEMASHAINAAKLLSLNIELPEKMSTRTATLKVGKDNKIIFSIKRESSDSLPPGFLEKKKTTYQKVLPYVSFNTNVEMDTINCDDIMRHIINETGENCGWMVNVEGKWNSEPLEHIKLSLTNSGLKSPEINSHCGACINRPWIQVNRPFCPEYPGGREWNMRSAQLKYIAKDIGADEQVSYPTWQMMFDHCGKYLNDTIKKHPWCKSNGILSGGEYLKLWVASLFQYPEQPLPFLFFYGEQNTGKSIFHESLQLLLTKGYIHAGHALSKNTEFNGELEGAVLCVIEELDLGKNTAAYNKIKDWVTSPKISIRRMYKPPHMITNTTHWIHVANNHTFCPIFPGDSRITMIYINKPEVEIPKKILLGKLEKEAEDLITDLLRIELPNPIDRLNIPIIVTNDKLAMQIANQSELATFLDENVISAPGYHISVKEFIEKFSISIDVNQLHRWPQKRITQELPPLYPKGRLISEQGQPFAFGNMKWDDGTPIDKRPKYVLNGINLEVEK